MAAFDPLQTLAGIDQSCKTGWAIILRRIECPGHKVVPAFWLTSTSDPKQTFEAWSMESKPSNGADCIHEWSAIRPKLSLATWLPL